jgi:hypothetical protein
MVALEDKMGATSLFICFNFYSYLLSLFVPERHSSRGQEMEELSHKELEQTLAETRKIIADLEKRNSSNVVNSSTSSNGSPSKHSKKHKKHKKSKARYRLSPFASCLCLC